MNDQNNDYTITSYMYMYKFVQHSSNNKQLNTIRSGAVCHACGTQY